MPFHDGPEYQDSALVVVIRDLDPARAYLVAEALVRVATLGQVDPGRASMFSYNDDLTVPESVTIDPAEPYEAGADLIRAIRVYEDAER